MSDTLDDAYRRAVYRLLLEDGPLDITVGTRNAPLRRLLADAGVQSAAFLTACNPGSRQADPATNQAAQAALLAAAADLGHASVPGVALDPYGAWPDEESVLLLGVDRATATRLARRFGQNALVWIDATSAPALAWVTGPGPR